MRADPKMTAQSPYGYGRSKHDAASATDAQIIESIVAYEALSQEELAIIGDDEHARRLEIWMETIDRLFPAIISRIRGA